MICWQSEGISITPNSLSWHSISLILMPTVCLFAPLCASPLLGAFLRQPFIGNAQAANQTIQHLSIQYLALSKDWINKNVASSEYNISSLIFGLEKFQIQFWKSRFKRSRSGRVSLTVLPFLAVQRRFRPIDIEKFISSLIFGLEKF